MTTIDLAVPPLRPAEPFAGVPRRVGLTLPELTHLCTAIGAPLAFESAAVAPASGLDARLGQGRSATDEARYAAALAALGSPTESLSRRGLIGEDGVEPGIAGALGLLATPSLAIELDVTIGSVHAHAWHRQNATGVATLATVDGLVFETSWFPLEAWTGELARAARLPEDTALRRSQLPDHVEVPFTVADAALEALRSGREDLVSVLTGDDPALTAVLTALVSETRGRLRVVATTATVEPAAPVGVASWVLVADGWRALRTQTIDDELRLVIARVEPTDLASELAPVLAEVLR